MTKYLNDYFQIDQFQDYGPQGLQVEGRGTVKKIVTSVSASVQLFEEAAGRARIGSGADNERPAFIQQRTT